MDILGKLKSLIKRVETKSVVHTISVSGTYTKDGNRVKDVLLLSIDNTERNPVERWVPTKNGFHAASLHNCLTTSEKYMRRYLSEERLRGYVRPPTGSTDLTLDMDTARVVQFTIDNQQTVEIEIL